jgi:hypothetical protein
MQYLKFDTFKSWWSDELKSLKSKAISSHKLWESAGKPKQGPIFEIKIKDKLTYKNEIRKSKDMEDACISDTLHEALLNKSNNAFWKTWNNKLNKGCNKKLEVDRVGSDSEIAAEFAKVFQKACMPNSEHFDTCKRAEFKSEYSNYIGDTMPVEQLTLSAEAVSLAVLKINKGKAPGLDGIMIEHLLNCHPIIYTLLAKLFNQIITSGHIPADFGHGIIIPLPKSESVGGRHKLDSFRGITLSPMISKIFEHCIMELLHDYLYSDDHQFGFKPKTGCSHAIYTVRLVVDYFLQNDSTINLCFIDVSKAFDRVNHSVLFMKLMKRRVPVAFITILRNWYDNLDARVRWNDVMSHTFKVCAGVRQGGILSPVLFLVYVNDMLIKLAKRGCNIGRLLVGAFMYADDLVLLSPSVYELQQMITTCESELLLLDLKINAAKSQCLRIGHRYNKQCCEMKSQTGNIPWVLEARYLGIYITSGRKFSSNFAHAKTKYYRSSNAILSKLGKQRNPAVALQLILSTAVPVLTYGMEALCLNKTQRQSLNLPWNRTFMKIFGTFDNKIVKQCQFYGGFLPVAYAIDIKRCEFLRKIPLTDNELLYSLSGLFISKDKEEIAGHYNLDLDGFFCKYNNIIKCHFADEVKSLFDST